MSSATTGSITDVAGILVGHHHRLCADATRETGWATGSTVVLTPPGTVGSVDVRGGAPGTRETDLLEPSNTVRLVDAVLLTGGSAYGLAAADGVMRWLEEHHRGVRFDTTAKAGTGDKVVPIVPAAVVFDLTVGDWCLRPDAEFGYAAAESAGTDVGLGSVGAGAGAHAGVLKGGIGTASMVLGSGVTVGALVVNNCVGDVIDPATGLPWASYLSQQLGLTAPPPAQVAAYGALVAQRDRFAAAFNSTIGVVATDAALSMSSCRRVAIAAHDGLARAIRPSHTPMDGDAVFALATGAVQVPPSGGLPASMSDEAELTAAVGTAAAECLAQAIVVAVLAATAVAGIPTYRDVLPGAFA
ncbi:MAG: P1 family peptidase [Mycobacteriaceae bacterium]|nr:P1 family peptidase [Mycobacteriaceae bacterium]MBV9640208.1 P1 family peptidase [Mycobacteriaceae bacterium]